MTTNNSSRFYFCTRVRSRGQLAVALRKPENAERVGRAGLRNSDLETIQVSGEQAERYDREQHADLADKRNELATTAVQWKEIDSESEQLRNRLPAAAADLEADPALEPHARWVQTVSFERFRIRRIGQAPATEEGQESFELKRVVRVDKVSRAQELLHFLRALLDPARAPIVAALEARGFDRNRLSDLANQAEGYLARVQVSTKMVGSEASQLESEAVARQKKQWDACKRMLRVAVQGDPTLERLFAAC